MLANIALLYTAPMPSKNLWAPWRLDYLTTLAADDRPQPAGCFLCEASDASLSPPHKRERLVLDRSDHAVLLLNRYPYTNGHLLVAPVQHVSDLLDLSPEQRNGVMHMITRAADLLKTAVHPQGYNVGFNVGRCAGAALPGHLHAHIVPRWHGDTNFMDAVGAVRVIPQALENSYDTMRKALSDLNL
jgi:ATP adenylyltransferase